MATELGVKPAAVRLGGNIVKSLWFESHDRKRTLLAAAGKSFYFPLMEKDLMDTGLKNMLETPRTCLSRPSWLHIARLGSWRPKAAQSLLSRTSR